MPEHIWLPNLGSQLDRALRAMLVAGGALTADQVFVANDYRRRSLPLLEIVSRRGSPSPGKRAKRVPPVPTPQEGTATKKSATFAVTLSMSIELRANFSPSA